MKIIGLSGPSGAGKSTICEQFEKFDIPCINTDEIYHSIIVPPSECLDVLCECFGRSILSQDGTLDRKKLSQLVFEGEDAKDNLEKLNRISHKYIWAEVNKLIVKYREEKKQAVVIDAPALFSSQIFVTACDFIISIIADKDIRLERIVQRDHIDTQTAKARLDAQPSDSFFINNSEYYINNSGDTEYRNKCLAEILRQEGITLNEKKDIQT